MRATDLGREHDVDLGIPGLVDAHLAGLGGTTRVHRARWADDGRFVAVKVLGTGVDGAARQRVDHERRVAEALGRHPAVVAPTGWGLSTRGEPYLLLPWFARGSLDDELAADGPLRWPDATALVAGLARALASLHAAGIVHGDIKPANVFRDAHDRPLLADLGVAGVGLPGRAAASEAADDGAGEGAAVVLTPAYSRPSKASGGL